MTLAMGDIINKISSQIFHLPSPPLHKCSYTRTNIFKMGYMDGYIKMRIQDDKYILVSPVCINAMYDYCLLLQTLKPYRPKENFSTGCWTLKSVQQCGSTFQTDQPGKAMFRKYKITLEHCYNEYKYVYMEIKIS